MSEAKPGFDPHPSSNYVSAAWERNRDPILEVFKTLFPAEGDALEFASGSGAHINYFAPHFPQIRFQPSDRDAGLFPMIASNRKRAGNANVRDPVLIDLTEPASWPRPQDRCYDAVFAINVLHLAPLFAADGFAAIASRILTPSGVAAIYGPFKVNGAYTSPSNEAFDRALAQAGAPAWGLKDVSDVEKAARTNGLLPLKRLALPANNLLIVFQKPEQATRC